MLYKIEVRIHECAPNGKSHATLISSAMHDEDAIAVWNDIRRQLGFGNTPSELNNLTPTTAEERARVDGLILKTGT